MRTGFVAPLRPRRNSPDRAMPVRVPLSHIDLSIRDPDGLKLEGVYEPGTNP